MWLDYNKELFGHDSIETEYGFICYIVRPPAVEIRELFVKKEFRHQGKARELIEKLLPIASEKTCSTLWAEVWLKSLGSNEILRAALTYGFKMYEADKNRITIVKEIGGLNG